MTEKINVNELLAAASAETGLHDFGPEEFREALHRYIDSSNDDVALNAVGVAAIKADVHRVLVNRLRFAEDLKRHPEILEEDVSDPIVITGMPRTGTTKLQRLLAADPDVQRLEHWRLLNPAPFPVTAPRGEDPRIEAARQSVAMMKQMIPMWLESHPTEVHEVDEEVFLQIYTFKSMILWMARPIPGYEAWMKTQSLRGTYEYMKQMLQYLQWQDGGRVGKNGGRPWIMKSPVHMNAMDLIMEFFPKATLVFTHRDPRQIIPSHCQLLEASRVIYSDTMDLRDVGRAALNDFLAELLKSIEMRDRMVSRLDILDVPFEQIRNDSIGVARSIYRKAGRELTPAREAAMRAWERAHPQHPSGKPDYRLERYGLSVADIDAAFKPCTDRFSALLR